METTKIFLSGITGHAGLEAIKTVRDVVDINIVTQMSCANVVIDSSGPEAFDEVLRAAVRTAKPFVSLAPSLSSRQMATLYDATNRIPIFRSVIVSRQAKQILDDYEASLMNFEHERPLHDGTDFAEVNFSAATEYPHIAQYVDATLHGEEILQDIANVFDCKMSVAKLYERWRVADVNRIMQGRRIDDIECRKNFAQDVLQIAKVMAKKPVKKGGFYYLDKLWNDLAS